jgi:ArsR family transcriptional regulator, arsenate/arsenite/antimonite-responsive transcriptional repressor
MDKSEALGALAALSHGTRLDLFRLLVAAGHEGMCVGAITRALDARQNTVSTNLAILTRAGLARFEREGRSIRYFAELDGMRALLSFLMQDCCGGRPEACAPLLDGIAGTA